MLYEFHPESKVEFKVLMETPSYLQKILNQWRHDYVMEIEIVAVDRGMVYALVMRERRTE